VTPNEFLFYTVLAHIVTISGVLAVVEYYRLSKEDSRE
jgi:hypothetical protein